MACRINIQCDRPRCAKLVVGRFRKFPGKEKPARVFNRKLHISHMLQHKASMEAGPAFSVPVSVVGPESDCKPGPQGNLTQPSDKPILHRMWSLEMLSLHSSSSESSRHESEEGGSEPSEGENESSEGESDSEEGESEVESGAGESQDVAAAGVKGKPACSFAGSFPSKLASLICIPGEDSSDEEDEDFDDSFRDDRKLKFTTCDDEVPLSSSGFMGSYKPACPMIDSSGSNIAFMAFKTCEKLKNGSMMQFPNISSGGVGCSVKNCDMSKTGTSSTRVIVCKAEVQVRFKCAVEKQKPSPQSDQPIQSNSSQNQTSDLPSKSSGEVNIEGSDMIDNNEFDELEQIIQDANHRWAAAYSDVPASPTQQLRIRFATNDKIKTVHPLVHWAYAHHAARKGPWEEMALDRSRFMRRVREVEASIGPTLLAKTLKGPAASGHGD